MFSRVGSGESARSTAQVACSKRAPSARCNSACRCRQCSSGSATNLNLGVLKLLACLGAISIGMTDIISITPNTVAGVPFFQQELCKIGLAINPSPPVASAPLR